MSASVDYMRGTRVRQQRSGATRNRTPSGSFVSRIERVNARDYLNQLEARDNPLKGFDFRAMEPDSMMTCDYSVAAVTRAINQNVGSLKGFRVKIDRERNPSEGQTVVLRLP